MTYVCDARSPLMCRMPLGCPIHDPASAVRPAGFPPAPSPAGRSGGAGRRGVTTVATACAPRASTAFVQTEGASAAGTTTPNNSDTPDLVAQGGGVIEAGQQASAGKEH